MISEESLDFQKEYKDPDAQIIEDEIMHHFPPPVEFPTNQCKEDKKDLSLDYKERAVNYWRSGKKNLSLESVQSKYKNVSSISQLRRWAHTVNQGGIYREKNLSNL
jgi:hypothetical protein